MKKYYLGLLFIFLILSSTGAICSKSGKMPDKVVLQYWSSSLNEGDISSAITAFETTYPYVDIQFKKLNDDEYEDALITGWAKNQGPDIFSVSDLSVNKFYDYIYPLPPSVTLTTVEQKSTFGKKETLISQTTQKSITVQDYKNQFVDAVYTDSVFPHRGEKENVETDKIFGLPLSIDTLALYWNKDLLNQATITLPATNWQEIADHTKDITKVDKEGNIIQSGIAMGTANNVPHYFDIMSVLMMQFGAPMATEQGNVIFNQTVGDDKRVPGQEALDFYVKFAQDKWETYDWNETKNDALEEFASGSVAYFIGYHSDLAKIKQISPNLNFDVAPLPQINAQQQINYPSFNIESVSINCKNKDLAWAFVQYLTNEQNTQQYVDATKQPSSRRNLISKQLEDYELATFAQQALTAKTWYHGKKPDEAINLFAKMIDNARTNLFTLPEIVGDTAAKIELTMK